jgi:hypothetical protein
VPRMADKGWTTRVATAAGVAAGTGAAQLGLGYGLGVVVWPQTTTADTSVWLGSLGWATWITASATVFGAVIASRLGGAPAERSRGPLGAALAFSAGVGALVAVALIALPARDAVRMEARTPQAIAAAYAIVGVVLGVLVAYWAVRSRPVAVNLIATAAWLWALAITAIVVELSLHRDSATYLTSWQFAEATSGGRYGTIYWPSALLTLTAAFLLGVLAALTAALRGDLGVGATTSGAVGPLLVAASFLMLAPRLTGDLGQLESAYLIAPYAVLAGLAGSALMITAARALSDRRAQRATNPAHDEAEADGPAGEAGARTRADTDTGVGAGTALDGPATGRDTTSSATGRDTTSSATGRAATIPSARSAAPGSSDAAPATGPAGLAEAPTPARRAKVTEAAAPARSARVTAAAGPAKAGRITETTKAAKPRESAEPVPSREAVEPAPATPTGRAKPPVPPSPTSGAAPKPTQAAPQPTPEASTKRDPEPTSAASAKRDPGPTSAASAKRDPEPIPTASARRDPEPTPVSQAKTPTPLNDPPAPPAGNPDPEIAAAARPGRFRGRKASQPAKTPEAKDPKSTVTPPPETPTVVRINPKPSADD